MANSTAMETFCENLERIRTEKGLTQVQLAQLLNTSQGNVSRLLAGGEDVTLSRLQRIAEALDVPLSELICEPSHAK